MYTILIVPSDLRREETIIQATYALDCLQKTIHTVFEKIGSRITENNDKVIILKARIAEAQTKIESQTCSKKSIKIYSPARFPASQAFQDIPLTFLRSINKSIMETKNLSLQYKMESQVVSPASPEEPDKLRFFHVRSTTLDLAHTLESTTKRVNRQSLEFFGEEIKSANSLLLLNKRVLVYTTKSDPNLRSWRGAKSRYNNEEVIAGHPIDKKKIEPAPHSLINKTHRHRLHVQRSLFYTPKLNKAPEINLPLHLPDLPGIADDVQFSGKEQQQIAPSLFIDNLPHFAELQLSVNIVSNLEYSNNQQLNMILSPPPPPPPPAAPVNMTVVNSPLPLLSESRLMEKLEKISSNITDANTLNCSSRSDLMDAIRKAGGALGGRLRAAADVGKSASQLSKNLTTDTDLMADLHNKLLMRRKGISGHKDREVSMSANDKVINHLSRIIPLPPTVRRKSQESTDEDDDEVWMD